MQPSPPTPSLSTDEWVHRFCGVRRFSESLAQDLETEDYVVQATPDASPLKWHLAHTTWFWETFLLKPYIAGYGSANPAYEMLFNSYYNAVGSQWTRHQRGLLTRPTVADTFAYRRQVDGRLLDLLCSCNTATLHDIAPVLELGLQHEQQHQELAITDLKALFALNPLRPVYRESKTSNAQPCAPRWISCEAGLTEIGTDEQSWHFDNEGPRHRVWLEAFALSSQLVTCGEWLEFMADGGYSRPELWLSIGRSHAQSEGWQAPLYWEKTPGAEKSGGGWSLMTLGGLRAVDPREPVAHISYFEADAFARWKGARLPTEVEWEVAARATPITGNFVEEGAWHPTLPAHEFEPFGNLWQWTRSSYSPYPGYEAAPGALGEYNGKFMCNQYVLRGGSCATPRSHIRATYRNFFPPDMRWQFCGLRLARDV